jgi:hypothetical protein
MEGTQILDIGKKDSHVKMYFKGVYAANTIPKKLLVHNLAIVNCCNQNLPGQHWVAICQTSQDTLEFFDSFGQTPSMYNLQAKLPTSQYIVLNPMTLQNIGSEVCGHYCLYYCYYKARGYSMDQLLNQNFSNDTLNNDSRVLSIVNKVFKLK